MNKRFSRRTLLQGLGAGALAVGASGLLPGGRAQASPTGQGPGPSNVVAETPHLVIIFLEGGLNSMFCSGDSFIGATADLSFGVTSDNTKQLGSSGVFVDRDTIFTLPAIALEHTAVIGCAHGLSAHTTARAGHFNDSSDNARMLLLADAMGSASPLKAVSIGSRIPYGSVSPYNDVTLQPITGLGPVVSAYGGTDSLGLDRASASLAIRSARRQSAVDFSASPQKLDTLGQAYDALPTVLESSGTVPDLATINAAYGLSATSTTVNNMNEQLRAADVMIQAGASVLTAISGGWDSHGDIDGNVVRTKMAAEIIPGLSIFLSRMFADPTRNVVTVITGDFARSLPGSNHQPNLSSIMFGRYCKVATTGRVDDDVRLPSGFTPGLNEHWSALAAALKLPTNPFGANPHTSLIL
jgi:hypothetical protein